MNNWLDQLTKAADTAKGFLGNKNNNPPPAPSQPAPAPTTPAWLMPVGLGVGALVLLAVFLKK